LKILKELHPKAVHHCFAFKLGLDDTNYRAVDDGEPSGSAGKPILGQIQSFQLTNTMVVVVRYFGGVLLGVPGLINAYKITAQLALQENEIIQKNVEVSYLIKFDYTLMNEVMRILKQYDCTILKHEMMLFCDLFFSVTLPNQEIVIQKINLLRTVELEKLTE
jgi:uncharacterized YigZ family protein